MSADIKYFLLAHCQTSDVQSCFTVTRHSFLIGFPITISNIYILSWIQIEFLKTINKLSTLHLPSKPDTSPFPIKMVTKLHVKKSQNYFRSMTKCVAEMSPLKIINTEPSIRKNVRF